MKKVLDLEGKKYIAYEEQLGNLNLLVVKGKRGYIASSYIDKGTAEKVGDVAGFVVGVRNLNEFMKAKLRHVTSWGEDFGLREGMSVRKALDLLEPHEEKG